MDEKNERKTFEIQRKWMIRKIGKLKIQNIFYENEKWMQIQCNTEKWKEEKRNVH